VGFNCFEIEAVGRDDMDELAIEPEDGACLRLAQVLCLGRNGIDNGLDVGGRARNDPKDLRRRSLLLQSLFRLVEQPHVLNRDNRLVGKGLEKSDLLIGERTDLVFDKSDHAE
jgi:hypothetical protein